MKEESWVQVSKKRKPKEGKKGNQKGPHQGSTYKYENIDYASQEDFFIGNFKKDQGSVRSRPHKVAAWKQPAQDEELKMPERILREPDNKEFFSRIDNLKNQSKKKTDNIDELIRQRNTLLGKVQEPKGSIVDEIRQIKAEIKELESNETYVRIQNQIKSLKEKMDQINSDKHSNYKRKTSDNKEEGKSFKAAQTEVDKEAVNSPEVNNLNKQIELLKKDKQAISDQIKAIYDEKNKAWDDYKNQQRLIRHIQNETERKERIKKEKREKPTKKSYDRLIQQCEDLKKYFVALIPKEEERKEEKAEDESANNAEFGCSQASTIKKKKKKESKKGKESKFLSIDFEILAKIKNTGLNPPTSEEEIEKFIELIEGKKDEFAKLKDDLKEDEQKEESKEEKKNDAPKEEAPKDEKKEETKNSDEKKNEESQPKKEGEEAKDEKKKDDANKKKGKKKKK